MNLIFVAMTEENAREMLTWRYDPPYDMNNMGRDEDTEADTFLALNYFLDPLYAFHTILNEATQEMVGFCSFGLDAQVPGGDYNEPALDIGLGMKPELTGQGRGTSFVKATIDYALETFQPSMLRVTIAAFNQRARRVWQKNGFHQTQQFENEKTGRTFVILTKNSVYLT